MKTYKQRLREYGLRWPYASTKGQLKALIRSHEQEIDVMVSKINTICEICTCDPFVLDCIHLHLDTLYMFVKFKLRLPTLEEVKEIRSFPDFKFWFNHHMNGTDNNSVWVFPSEIWTKYHSL